MFRNPLFTIDYTESIKWHNETCHWYLKVIDQNIHKYISSVKGFCIRTGGVLREDIYLNIPQKNLYMICKPLDQMILKNKLKKKFELKGKLLKGKTVNPKKSNVLLYQQTNE